MGFYHEPPAAILREKNRLSGHPGFVGTSGHFSLVVWLPFQVFVPGPLQTGPDVPACGDSFMLTLNM